MEKSFFSYFFSELLDGFEFLIFHPNCPTWSNLWNCEAVTMCFNRLTKPFSKFLRSASERGLLCQYPLAFRSQQVQLFVLESPLLENQVFVRERWRRKFGLSLGFTLKTKTYCQHSNKELLQLSTVYCLVLIFNKYSNINLNCQNLLLLQIFYWRRDKHLKIKINILCKLKTNIYKIYVRKFL